MGNEQSINSKKYKSNIKYSNSILNNYSTISNDEATKPYSSESHDAIKFFINFRKHFESPSMAKFQSNSNTNIKEFNLNLKKISQKEKIIEISQRLISLIPDGLSEYNNIDFITSNFGLKSIENNQNFKINSNRIYNSNKGTGFGENLIKDDKLNFFLEITQIAEKEKISEKLNNDNSLPYKNNTENNFTNEPSLIKEVNDTSTSFINILEEFENLSSSAMKIENQGDNELNSSKNSSNNMNRNQICNKDKKPQNNLNKSKIKISPNQSIEQEYNSNPIANQIINNPQKKYVKNINLKNNMKVIQVNRSKDKVRQVDESRISSKDKMNVSQSNINDHSMMVLNKSKNNLIVTKEVHPTKVKNIKINLSGKQKSASPDKKVLAKIEQPSLIIDLTNRRNQKLNTDEKNLNNSTLIANVSRTNVSKSPAKDLKDKTLYSNYKNEPLVNSPSESMYSSQFDSNQNIYPSSKDMNKSGNKTKKLDVNVIKINPQILKTEKNKKIQINEKGLNAIDNELYNTYSKLKMRSLEPAIKDNKNKKILNSSNISEDDKNNNLRVNASITNEKDPKMDIRNITNDKDSQQQKIKNINININEINIINKEQNKNKQDKNQNNNTNMNYLSNGNSHNPNKNSLKDILNEKKELVKTKINDNIKVENKKSLLENNLNQNNSSPLSYKEKSNKEYRNQINSLVNENSQFNMNNSRINIEKSPDPKSDNQPVKNLENSLNDPNDLQKLYKLKSLKINLNINQLKKIKDKENIFMNENKLDDVYIEETNTKLKPFKSSDNNTQNIFEKKPPEIIDKNEFELSESESNSRDTTPPKRNTPKFTKSNSNSSDVGNLSDDSNKSDVNVNKNSKSNKILNNEYDLGSTYLVNEDSFMTKINYKHQHRKSNSFGGNNNINNISTANNINITDTENNPNDKTNMIQNKNTQDKSEFNPTINHFKIYLKESIEGEKFSFQNDLQENSLFNQNQDNSDSKSNFTRNAYKYVKPKVGFKKSPREILNRSKIDETNASINVEKKSLQSEQSELSNQILTEFSTNKSPKNDSLIAFDEKSAMPLEITETREYTKSKLLYKKNKN